MANGYHRYDGIFHFHTIPLYKACLQCELQGDSVHFFSTTSLKRSIGSVVAYQLETISPWTQNTDSFPHIDNSIFLVWRDWIFQPGSNTCMSIAMVAWLPFCGVMSDVSESRMDYNGQMNSKFWYCSRWKVLKVSCEKALFEYTFTYFWPWLHPNC